MMAVDRLDHTTDIDTPTVASAASWTGGLTPEKKTSKFELWAKAHPKISVAVLIVVIALINADQARHGHAISTSQFLEMFVLAAASLSLMGVALIGVFAGYNWIARRAKQSSSTLQSSQKKYIALLLFIGLLMSPFIVPFLVTRLLLGLALLAGHL